MDRIDELKYLIENCKKMIESSEKEIEMLKSKEPIFERVEKGKKYYVVDVDPYGRVLAKEYIEKHMSFDEYCFENNNYFLTKERAEEVADKINFLLKLERLHDTFCPDYKPDWEDERPKWAVFFADDDKEYITIWTTCPKGCTTVYFDSLETAKKVCEILNKELEK